jgi:hypothetical protein
VYCKNELNIFAVVFINISFLSFFLFSSLGLSGGKTKTKYLEREVERAKIPLNNQEEEEEDDGDEEEFFFFTRKKNILKLQTQKGRANGHFCCGTRLESNFMKNWEKYWKTKRNKQM